MKVYIIKESKFFFNGKESYDLPLMGKSSMDILLKEFPEADCLSQEDFDLKKFDCSDGALLIRSSYPMFSRKDADKIVKYFRNNKFVTVKFPAGLVLVKGHLSETESIDYSSGTPLDSLASYPVVLEEVRKSVLSSLMSNGVMIEDPASAYISLDAQIEAGATIMHDCHIMGASVIKSGAVVKPYSNIENSIIGHNTTVTASTLDNASVGNNTTVGPNAYLRPDSYIGDDCRIGDFVEIKNAKIGNGTKISHLSYVGDADVGERVNVGCGVVFVNYDGKNKHRSRVGNECFLGSNCNLVAPVTLGDHSFVAAGTTLTKDLQRGDFCIGRCRETVKADRAFDYYGTKGN